MPRADLLRWLIAGTLIVLPACSAAAPAAPPPGLVVHAAAEAGPTVSPPPPPAISIPAASATPPPLPTATPARAPAATRCAETRGVTETLKIDSPTLNYPIDGRIYLPPCYAADDRRYPVLYLMHGLDFTDDQWERLGMVAAADALTAAGEVAPLIIVMPRDRRDDRLDRAFVNDLVPHIDQAYRTLAGREFRAIGGLSRGGGWAARIGLQFPQTFGRIGLHSAAVFYGDENRIVRWTQHLPRLRAPALYVDVGEGDSLVRSSAWLDQIFTWFKLEHTFVLRPGAHHEKYWAAHVEEYLRFYAADWRSQPAVEEPLPDGIQ